MKYVVQPLLSQSTALNVFTMHLFLDYLSGCLFCNRGIFRIFALTLKLFPQINLISNEYLGSSWHTIFKFWKPLNNNSVTFFLAFKKDGGSITEKQIKKTSQWGYANGRSRLYYYCPAVSLIHLYFYHKPRLTIFPSTFNVVEKLSKTVGS